MDDITLLRDDSLAAVPGAHVWIVLRGEDVLGVVASGERVWYAAQVMPSRSRRWGNMKTAATRKAAVALLVSQ